MAASATLFGKTAAGKFGLNERASHAIWPGMGMKIYKILTREQWDQARQTGMLKGAPVDLADGFIHFSTASQLAETARLYFVGMDDLILLGVGDDGHTASLFPGSLALDERERWVAVTHAPVEPHTRLTLTYPVIDNAKRIMFLVAGEKKQPILRAIMEEPQRAREIYPSARVEGEQVEWLVSLNA